MTSGRVGAQVRRALIAAAKTAAVASTIDAVGCSDDLCAFYPPPLDSGSGGIVGTGGAIATGGVRFGTGGTGGRTSDASGDAQKPDAAASDASKDGG